MASSIVDIVRSVIGDAKPKTIHDPYIMPEDIRRVFDTLQRSPVGYAAILDFENAVALRCQRRYALAVCSGTAALHLAMLSVGVKVGGMVAMPTLNFVASAAMARQCGAVIYFHANRVMPVGAGFAARIQVQLLGYPEEPSRFEKMFDVPVIEDAAEALGSQIDGKACGSFGDVSIISFNNNKIVTTGGGGMLLTDDHGIYERAKHLATTARAPGDEYWHDQVGFNYRMPNHCAALGFGQVARLDLVLSYKRSLTGRYRKAFAGTRFTFFDVERGSPNFWINAVTCPTSQDARAALMDLKAAGIPSRPMFTPLHMLPPYVRYVPRAADPDLVAVRETAARMVLLPSGAGL